MLRLLYAAINVASFVILLNIGLTSLALKLGFVAT
jgi:hypothetical protein